MSIQSAQVLRVLGGSHRPMGVREILRQGGFHPGQQTELKRVLRELLRSGAVEKEGKRFKVPGATPVPETPGEAMPRPRREPRERAPQREGPPRRERGRSRAAPTVEGILHVHRDGFGFVHPLHGEGENIYLPGHEASRALDGDRVKVEVVEGRGGRTSGVLVDVVGRIRQRAVGVYRQEGRRAWVIPNDRSLPSDIRVPPTQMARNGDLVKVVLGIGAQVLEPGVELFGEVTGSLGEPGAPSGEVLSIAYAQGFNDEFPDEAMAEADAYATEVDAEEALAEGRRDLRALPLVTIDGADARDFDDAVYAEPDAGGWRLVVAIADVSHYVRPGSSLDTEALARGTSVYLPDRVLPMLPERLSNGICSLRPDEDRLCLAAELTLSSTGELREADIFPAVMRSAARCTYEEVQEVLDGQKVPHRSVFRPHFENLMALARVLHEMRSARGAIDFDLPEYKVVLDESGAPVRLDRRERKDSHRLIEECMLAANEAVARFFRERELPSVYRFHGEPDEEKLEIFGALARAHGFDIGKEGDVTSHQLNHFLEQLEGHPERRALNQLLLRSMMQAVYSAENVGHYGLGAEHYLHFTSPIRRYPDLLVHRLLKANWARKGRIPPQAEREAEEQRLEELAVQSSERERAAVSVEREVVAYYTTVLMKDRVGEEFDATVSSLTDFGFFVELDELHVEGLVKAESVGIGARFDPVVYALGWPDGRRVRVGDALRVRLLSANVERRQLDFAAISLAGEDVVPLDVPERGRRSRPAERAPTERGGERGESRRRPRGRPAVREERVEREAGPAQGVSDRGAEGGRRYAHPTREAILSGAAKGARGERGGRVKKADGAKGARRGGKDKPRGGGGRRR